MSFGEWMPDTVRGVITTFCSVDNRRLVERARHAELLVDTAAEVIARWELNYSYFGYEPLGKLVEPLKSKEGSISGERRLLMSKSLLHKSHQLINARRLKIQQRIIAGCPIARVDGLFFNFLVDGEALLELVPCSRIDNGKVQVAKFGLSTNLGHTWKPLEL